MTLNRYSPIVRALCLLLALALFTVSCGGSDDDEDTAEEPRSADVSFTLPGKEACDLLPDPGNTVTPDGLGTQSNDPVQGGTEPGIPDLDLTRKVELPTSVLRVLPSLCDTLGGDFTIGACTDESKFFPEVRVGGELLYSGHMMVRFHPVDSWKKFDADSDFDSRRSSLDSEPTASVIVIDTGRHGRHGAQIIADMLDVEFTEINPAEFAAGSDPISPVTYLPIVSSSTVEDGFAAAESTVVEALESIATRLDETGGDQQLIVNMSFGTHQCSDEPPPALLAAIDALKAKDVQLVASAGNDEYDGDVWPAALSSVTAVGSISNADGSPRSCFSNYAPNTTIWFEGELIAAETDGELGIWSGTSFAAPQAAAFLAAGLQNQSVSSVPDTENVAQTYRLTVDNQTILASDDNPVDIQTTCAGPQWGPDDTFWKAVPDS